ncbi:MAG: hypothetical protein V2A74_07535 [bacterium]
MPIGQDLEGLGKVPSEKIAPQLKKGGAPPKRVVYQPSHQTDTGENWNEAEVCNAIVEQAMAVPSKLVELKVWSYDRDDVHHAREGSNSMIEHTSAVIDGKISGYAWEIKEGRKHKPDVWVSVHVNGATERNAAIGFVHGFDLNESVCRELAYDLVTEICDATGMENGGVMRDAELARNDYVCQKSGKPAFYSLCELNNYATHRVLLEVGDNAVSRDFLLDPKNQRRIGKAIKKVLCRWYED